MPRVIIVINNVKIKEIPHLLLIKKLHRMYNDRSYVLLANDY
ncbi:hypothetical protein [Brevibacillus formosus]